ncbi:glycine cleavage system aminomethyltransferase GcvT [Waterburya agarophytonicola K14]|uniref:Aminomethyltransferase n=1 Tax=Waterburya agarophytonicola KI4 TaxID=2874699 RepID=A0A964BP77_9CYAN|nr:glycine cleavage system aminomethyltransferase GcvT [Waterburya agarophytonicola]MCC0176271.1 glycine cleavage system aminomethyltransferase GcvT [Waterburya agarophytonicola KI4]
MADNQSSNLLRTPLFELAQSQKARFTAFSGWEMPVQYQGLKLEHQAVRSHVGMFDISHMGKFTFEGQGLIDAWQTLVPSDLSRLKPGEAMYTVLLNAEGGIIDDIIFYLSSATQSEQKAVVIVNAGTTDKDKNWILSHLQDSSIVMKDISREQALIALQGSQAATVLQTLVKEDLSKMKAFRHQTVDVNGEPAFIARTGYTGEDGFEIMLAPEAARELWQSLLSAGVIPCGLGARDTLRLEAAMSLYGQDIDETTTPLEASLGWVVHLQDKGDFIGRESLESQKASGIKRRLVGIEMSGRHIARHGYRVMYEGKTVGEVTSGTLAPTIEKAIALAYVAKDLSKVGQALEIEIRGKTHPATVVKKPFYRSPHQ